EQWRFTPMLHVGMLETEVTGVLGPQSIHSPKAGEGADVMQYWFPQSKAGLSISLRRGTVGAILIAKAGDAERFLLWSASYLRLSTLLSESRWVFSQSGEVSRWQMSERPRGHPGEQRRSTVSIDLVEKIVGALEQGNIVFNAPSSMLYDKEGEVQ